MKSLRALRFRHPGLPQRGLPEEVVEVVAVQRGRLTSPHQQSRRDQLAVWVLPRQRHCQRRELLSVRADRTGDAVWQRDLPRFAMLGRPEHQTTAHDLDLPNDLDCAIGEVHLINAKPERLALAQTTPGSEVHRESVPLPHLGPDGVHSLGRPRNDLWVLAARPGNRPTSVRVAPDSLVIDRGGEHPRHVREEGPSVGLGQALLLQPPTPRLDHGWADRAQLGVTEMGVNVPD
jgi:hypothetical protein